MKSMIVLAFLAVSFAANADMGPYFPKAEKAPIKSGKLIFNSPELSSLGQDQYIGLVVVEKFTGGYEVAPMIYNCLFNVEDDSIECTYLRYDEKNAKSYNTCEIVLNEYFGCY